MAAVRARRGGRMPPGPPPRGKRRKASPPVPAYESMPRLARIKLSGGITGDDVHVSGKSLMLALTGAVIFLGAGVAGAAWLGSSLFDVREAFAQGADSVAAGAGFEIDAIEIAAAPNAAALTEARKNEVRELIVPDDRRSLLALDPQDVQARVESLDWVASARVRRLWPSTLVIEVERRQSYARWRENGQISVIDVNGERLLSERAADHPDLPLIVGAGAGPAAQPLLVALEDLPQLRARLQSLVRVGDRRWNVELENGATIALPEEGAVEALQSLESLQDDYALLDRPLAQLDMRAPGRIAVRVHPALAGGMRPLLGGA